MFPMYPDKPEQMKTMRQKRNRRCSTYACSFLYRSHTWKNRRESIYNYWGESNLIEKFEGLEDKLDPLYDKDNPDVYWNAFEEHMKDNLDKYYEIIKDFINNSYPDGDSANGVVLLVDGKEVAGANNGRLVNFF